MSEATESVEVIVQRLAVLKLATELLPVIGLTPTGDMVTEDDVDEFARWVNDADATGLSIVAVLLGVIRNFAQLREATLRASRAAGITDEQFADAVWAQLGSMGLHAPEGGEEEA